MRSDIFTVDANINNDPEVRRYIELATEAFHMRDHYGCCVYVDRARSLNDSFADSFYLLAACHKYNSVKSTRRYLDKAQSCASSLGIFGEQDFVRYQRDLNPQFLTPPQIRF